MHDVGVSATVNHARLCIVIILLTASLAIGAADSPSSVFAQGSGEWAIGQAQRAVRQQIIDQEGGREAGRNLTVQFNSDAQTESVSNSGVLVRGTGVFSPNNDSRYNNSRNNNRRTREFTYEATVNNRNRNRNRNNNNSNVSGIRYDWSDGWSGNGGANNGGGRGFGNNRGYSNAKRPDGRVSHSGSIMNRHSDKALDVAAQSMQDGANIQQWSYANQPNQTWDVVDLDNGEVAIISRHSGKAITVQVGRGNNGANIIQRTWNESRQQRWRLEKVGGDYYRIVSVENGRCLDVTEQGRQDGANIQLWDYANQANQQWRFNR